MVAVVEVGESGGVVSAGADIEDSGAESFSDGEDVVGESSTVRDGMSVAADGVSLLVAPHAARRTAPATTVIMRKLRLAMASN